MNHLQKGQFYGETNTTIHQEGITLTDTVYTHDKVDWHYHEHAYFTFILQGNVTEGNKKEVYNCSPGSLLFHNWQEPHYNIKPEGFTRGFHIEIEQQWFDALHFNADGIQGSSNLANPDLKFLFYKLFAETKINDASSTLSIQGLLLQTLSQMVRNEQYSISKKPAWVYSINEILNEQFTDALTLEYLSAATGIHPVHLSREFPKYFNCSFGEYIRKLKTERSLSLLANKRIDLTAIAYECGFADQSHFTRCFKAINGITPSTYRRLLLG